MTDFFIEEETKKRFKFLDAHLPEALDLKRHVVLFPPMPCCAQLAAPFWAKIIGLINNRTDKELLIEATVILYDQYRNIIKECSEDMFLDGISECEFDIQIPHLMPVPSMYSIKVDIKEEM